MQLVKIIKPKVMFFNDSKLGGDYQNFFFPYGNITVYHSSKVFFDDFKDELDNEDIEFVEVECSEIDEAENKIEKG